MANDAANSNAPQASRLRTVLCVDDNAINREILSEVLSDDYQVLTAANGAEALETLRSGIGISAVLLDLLMPVMDGRTFLKELAQDPALRDIPVLVVTGDESADAEADCLDLGASDFIPKPVDPKIAKKRVASAVRLREASAAISTLGTDPDTGLFTRRAFVRAAEDALQMYEASQLFLIVTSVVEFAALCTRFPVRSITDMLASIGEAVRADTTNVASGYLGEGRFAILRRGTDLSSVAKGAQSNDEKAQDRLAIEIDLKTAIVPFKACNGSILQALSYAADAVGRISNDTGTTIVCFDEAAEQAAQRRRVLHASARKSLEDGDFYVVYQPKHDVHTGKLVGCETLVRWTHPELGFVSPGEFIPLLEESGFVREVDTFVRKQACKDARAWKEAGLEPIAISVNFSRAELGDSAYIEGVLADPDSQEMADAGLLHAEVTETMWSKDPATVEHNIHLLKDAGYQIELDDFGSGYSSMSMVAKLPLDVIKLDMSLVRELDVQEPVIECAVLLAHKLNRITIAEGVEDAETLARLADLGVDVVQGYYYSRPLPFDEFTEYIRHAQRGA